jgi:uncharacterized damage-inducible protein DinB
MDALSEAFQYHGWATERLIRHLRTLPPPALSATAAGVYGDPVATLSHVVAADGRLLNDLEGAPNAPRTGPDPVRSLDELADELRDQAVRWRMVLPRLPQLDVAIPARGERPRLEHATNLPVVQSLQHGNDHRSQVCTVLSANGFEVPRLDVYAYWLDRRAVPEA